MKGTMERAVILVLDSVGIGEAPDAAAYGDEGSNTLGNTAKAVGGLSLPNLQKLGLGNITAIKGVPPVPDPRGAFGRMREVSRGKDTTTGHWELAGLCLDRAFPTYPMGFPAEVIEPFEQRIGRSILGNKVASGTEIIKELGAKHIETGQPIVYTSADSVFQIAAHEDVVPVDELYSMCRIAREILQGEHGVGRVIARPFIGTPGHFVRTGARRDFSLEPPQLTVLDHALNAGVHVAAVGKITDIFAGRGISESTSTANNDETLDATINYLHDVKGPAIIFANCVDFDALWGHRNDPYGYAQGLESFDRRLPELLAALKSQDVLFIVADHGCDPTTPSTDHSRELVPLLVYGSSIKPGINLGLRDTFADVAATVAEGLSISPPLFGTSFWTEVYGVPTRM